jgi:hypothetical protein
MSLPERVATDPTAYDPPRKNPLAGFHFAHVTIRFRPALGPPKDKRAATPDRTQRPRTDGNEAATVLYAALH